MHEDPQIPDAWRIRVRQVLAADEPVLAWFEPDLDARLFFTRGLVVLTDRRLLEWNAAQPGPESAPARQWPLRTDLSLQHTDHAGVGQLELHDASSRLASWRYTLAHQASVNVLTTEFARQQGAYLAGRRLAPRELAGCPVCGRPLLAGQESCTYCGDESPEAPSSWTLLRLWRFAQPYRGQLLLGLVLTLASTAATLVPPYLTLPLMDRVLVPFQNGAPLDWGLDSSLGRKAARFSFGIFIIK